MAADADLAADLVKLSGELEEAHRRIDRLTDEIAAANALAWDHVALSRRLAQIEDELAQNTSRPDSDKRAATGHSGF